MTCSRRFASRRETVEPASRSRGAPSWSDLTFWSSDDAKRSSRVPHQIVRRAFSLLGCSREELASWFLDILRPEKIRGSLFEVLVRRSQAFSSCFSGRSMLSGKLGRMFLFQECPPRFVCRRSGDHYGDLCAAFLQRTGAQTPNFDMSTFTMRADERLSPNKPKNKERN